MRNWILHLQGDLLWQNFKKMYFFFTKPHTFSTFRMNICEQFLSNRAKIKGVFCWGMSCKWVYYYETMTLTFFSHWNHTGENISKKTTMKCFLLYVVQVYTLITPKLTEKNFSVTLFFCSRNFQCFSEGNVRYYLKLLYLQHNVESPRCPRLHRPYFACNRFGTFWLIGKNLESFYVCEVNSVNV